MLSVKTISVARAYFLPVWGLDGAGDGGRSCPSRSMCAKALLSTLVFGVEAADRSGIEEEEPDSDIALKREMEMVGYRAQSNFRSLSAYCFKLFLSSFVISVD